MRKAAIAVAMTVFTAVLLGATAFREQVTPVEDHPRVDVPGNPERRVVDDVGVPDAVEECVRLDDGGPRDVAVEWLERMDGGQLRHPRVAQLRDVGRRRAGRDEAGAGP